MNDESRGTSTWQGTSLLPETRLSPVESSSRLNLLLAVLAWTCVFLALPSPFRFLSLLVEATSKLSPLPQPRTDGG